jgi:hypothetical protein
LTPFYKVLILVFIMPAICLGQAPGGWFLQYSKEGALSCDDKDPVTLNPLEEGQVCYRFGDKTHDNIVCLHSFMRCIFTSQRHPVTNVTYTDAQLSRFDCLHTHISRALDENDDWHAAALMAVQAFLREQDIWDGYTLHWPATEPIVANDVAYYGDLLGECTELVIPASVTEIAEFACAYNKDLHMVVFAPNATLVSIGSSAFVSTRLRRIVLPVTTTSIGDRAFADSKLRHVTFTGNLAIMGRDAFSGTDLTSVIIPASLTTIPAGAFLSCARLTVLTFARGSQCTSIGAYAFSGTRLKAVHVPARVEKIGACAFRECEYLQRLTFASRAQLHSIGVEAFQSTKIRFLQLPETVKMIHPKAFAFCSALAKVILSPNLIVLGSGCFQSTALTKITIPNSVLQLSREAFYNCSALKTVVLGNDVQCISIQAFAQTGVESIAIPDTVKKIDIRAFYQCSSLSYLHFNAASCLEEIAPKAFANCDLLQVALPAQIKTLGGECFGNNYNLTALTLPRDNQLTRVEAGAVNNTQVWRIENVPETATTGKSYVQIETEMVRRK